MKRILFALFLFLSIACKCQNVAVKFMPASHFNPYCSVITLKTGFRPYERWHLEVKYAQFEYADKSTIFQSNGGWTKNMDKWSGPNVFREKYKGAPIGYQIVDNDTILKYVFEGVDSVGKYWREDVYLNQLRVNQDSIFNTGWYEAVVGYYYVCKEKKETFDSMLDTFTILPPDKCDFNFKGEYRYFNILKDD